MPDNNTNSTKLIIKADTWVYKTMSTDRKQIIGRLYAGAKISGYLIPTDPYYQIVSDKPTNGENFMYGVIKDGYLKFSDELGIVNNLELDEEQEKTTEAKKDANGNTINTDENGNETTTESETELPGVYLDDAFLEEFETRMNNSEYRSSLEGGFDMLDMRGILGIPPQFLPTTDARVYSKKESGNDGKISYTGDDLSALGRVYTDKIIANMPLLLMTPGTPSFMASFSKEQKETALQSLLTDITSVELELLVNENSGKYYSLKYAYTDYFYYVNAMLRAAAVYLGIDEAMINGKKLYDVNWMYSPLTEGSDIWSHKGLSRFLGPYAGAVAFYADVGTTVSDSFSNSTTQSMLASSMNGLSDAGREINFLAGNVGSMLGINLTKLTGSEEILTSIENMQHTIDGILGTGNIVTNIVNKAQTLLAGGKLVFPEIWSDSTFGRSYSCSMKLVCLAGDPFSQYLTMLVPLYHLCAFCWPRQAVGQSYFSPFLIRAYSKGTFNVDMGIMTSLNVTKGAEGWWGSNGVPTVMDISFDIKDLYEGIFMSSAKQYNDINIMSNIAELDYIANTCGVNVNDQEILRTIKLYMALNVRGRWADNVSIGIFGSIHQYFNQVKANIFGVF